MFDNALVPLAHCQVPIAAEAALEDSGKTFRAMQAYVMDD
jgi:hypothetical protein